MAEQTVEAGTVAVVLVNVIDDNGDHVAATIDTTTTRLQKGDTSDTTWNNVVPTYDIIATGVYRIKFSSLSPAIVVDDNDELIRVKINGTISGTAWTEYHMPLKVLTAGGGGGGGGDATAANQTTIINHLTDVKGTSFVKDTHSLTDITADVTGLNGDVMRGTDGANTVAPDNTSIAAILVDTGTTIPNSISALNDFDPALDTVASVTTVGSVTNPVTTDTASRDASKADVTGLSTFDASTDTVTTDAASRTASQADVSALATSASIAALNDLSSADVNTQVDTALSDIGLDHLVSASVTGTDITDNSIIAYMVSKSATADWDSFVNTTDALEALADAGGDATAANQTTIINHLTDVKGTSFVKDTHSLTDITADVTGLNGDAMRGTDSAFLAASAPSNFSSLAINASGHVSRVTLTDTTTTNTDMRGTESALLASSAPSNWSTLIVGTGADAGKVTTSNPAAGSGSSHTAQDVANLILVTPANKLATDSSGNVEANNLSAVSTNVTSVKAVTDKLDTALQQDGGVYQFTINALEQAPSSGAGGGGSAPTEADIYTYFTASSREDAFKADVTSLATAASIAALNDFDPATDTVANVTTVATTTTNTDVTSVKAVTDKLDTALQLDGSVYRFTSNALEQAPSSGSGGVVGPGASPHEVTITSGGTPVDGAEVWVTTDSAGTNVVAGTLNTDAFGKATFMLDAGTYYLWAQAGGVNFTNPTSFTVS